MNKVYRSAVKHSYFKDEGYSSDFAARAHLGREGLGFWLSSDGSGD